MLCAFNYVCVFTCVFICIRKRELEQGVMCFEHVLKFTDIILIEKQREYGLLTSYICKVGVNRNNTKIYDNSKTQITFVAVNCNSYPFFLLQKCLLFLVLYSGHGFYYDLIWRLDLM